MQDEPMPAGAKFHFAERKRNAKRPPLESEDRPANSRTIGQPADEPMHAVPGIPPSGPRILTICPKGLNATLEQIGRIGVSFKPENEHSEAALNVAIGVGSPLPVTSPAWAVPTPPNNVAAQIAAPSICCSCDSLVPRRIDRSIHLHRREPRSRSGLYRV